MTRIAAGMPQAVVRSSREVYADAEGTYHKGLHVTLPAENVEELRSGYRCLNCFARQEEPFPEQCIESYCRFPMKRKQMTEFARQFQGGEDLWPNRRTAAAERAYEREQHLFYAQKAGVELWTPQGEVPVEAPKPLYPEMSFEEFLAEPLPRRWKRRA